MVTYFIRVQKLVPHINGRNTLRIIEGRMLRRIFGHKCYEITGGWKNFITLRIMIYLRYRMLNSREMRWAGHEARLRDVGNTY